MLKSVAVLPPIQSVKVLCHLLGCSLKLPLGRKLLNPFNGEAMLQQSLADQKREGMTIAGMGLQ